MLLHRQHLDIEPPALVSAGPWQGLDATAYLRICICVFVCCRIWRNKERIIIIGGLGRSPHRGSRRHSPRWRVRHSSNSDQSTDYRGSAWFQIRPLHCHNISIGQKFAVDKMNTAKTAVSHSGSEARGPEQGPTSPMPRAGSAWTRLQFRPANLARKVSTKCCPTKRDSTRAAITN